VPFNTRNRGAVSRVFSPRVFHAKTCLPPHGRRVPPPRNREGDMWIRTSTRAWLQSQRMQRGTSITTDATDMSSMIHRTPSTEMIADFQTLKVQGSDRETLDHWDPRLFDPSSELLQEFPRLTRMTRQYLAVPASSASPERLFSSVGLVVGSSPGHHLD